MQYHDIEFNLLAMVIHVNGIRRETQKEAIDFALTLFEPGIVGSLQVMSVKSEPEELVMQRALKMPV